MTVRIGIVGAGGNARSHARRLQSVGGAKVTAVQDVDAGAANALAEYLGCDAVSTLEELLDSCDAVYVCTWTSQHAGIVAAAAAAGRAVFCEKPLGRNLSEARTMVDLVHHAGVVNQVGLSLRWNPAFAVLRHELSNPSNGRMLTAALYSEMPNRQKITAGWRGDYSVSGGGMLVEIGFHDLDVMQWLVGPVGRVSAATIPGVREGIEDGAAVSMQFDIGAVGTLTAVWHDAPRCRQIRRLEVVCEHARLRLVTGPEVCELVVSGPADRRIEAGAEDVARMAAELDLATDPDAAFIRAVVDGHSATPNMDDGLVAQSLVEAAYRSAGEGGSWTGHGEGLRTAI